MSDITTLKCWPSSILGLDWSQDGIIALASHDKVELLFPNIQAQESDSDIPQWRHFPLPVPWFTKEELPQRESAPFEIFSIGEEISTSYPVSVAWSPPGLARNRRCALGVLTSNLVLSIWESDGNPQHESSWARVSIINDTLKEYFSTEETQTTSYITSSIDEVTRIRQRVRAFTWAPGSPSEEAVGIVGTSTSWLRHMLAVSNDNNQIVILAVYSPTSKLGVDDSWSSSVLGCFSIATRCPEVDIDSFTFDDIMDQQRHINHISWSPWITIERGLRSVLAYATNEDLRLRTISYFDGKLKLGEETICSKVELRFSGPIIWSPEVGFDGMLLLSYFTTQKVVFLTVSPNDASILSRKCHYLDRRWDRISGAVWDTHDRDHPRIHFSSHTSTTQSPTAVLELSSDSVSSISTSDWPYWREQISGSQGHFSAENELKGHANAKVWGLSASPLGEFIASSHTLHPTDMIEYGVAADRTSTIAITNLWGDGNDLSFPAKAVSAEGIFFTTRKWIEKNVESSDELPPIREDIRKKLMQSYMPTNEFTISQRRSYELLDLEALSSAFKCNAFLDVNTLRDRYDILSSCICTPAEPTALPRMLIAFRLAKELRNLPTALCSNHGLSRQILKSHLHLIRLVEELISEDEPVPGADVEGELDLESRQSASGSPPPCPENCTFCDALIPFSDPSSATCLSGHEFIRCGLSFIAIQAPGQTKTCGICGTPFLAEHVISGANNDNYSRAPSPVLDEGVSSKLDKRADTAMSGALSGLQVDGARDGPGGRGRASRNKDITEVLEEAETPAPTAAYSPESPFVDRIGGSNTNSHGGDASLTLAKVLFLACDACIYCGGKYVG